MGHFVYILQSEENDRYYVGRSQNPQRRLKHHNTTSTGFTSRYRPWKLAYTHEFSTTAEAVEAETLIKGWKSRKMTRYVIEERSSWKSASSSACGCYADSVGMRGRIQPGEPKA